MTNRVNYSKQVFINCPFDLEYLDLYRACIFTIIDAGFKPRCSREINNGNHFRLDNIVKLIRECRYGIHDISRVTLDETHNLPRFNMPFEYGVFYGSQRFGDSEDNKKCSLVLEKEAYSYQKFLSDIAGIDVVAHNNNKDTLITSIRDWLHTSSKRKTIPNSNQIVTRFNLFQIYIKKLCSDDNTNYDEMTFADLVVNMSDWLKYTKLDNP